MVDGFSSPNFWSLHLFFLIPFHCVQISVLCVSFLFLVFIVTELQPVSPPKPMYYDSFFYTYVFVAIHFLIHHFPQTPRRTLTDLFSLVSRINDVFPFASYPIIRSTRSAASSFCALHTRTHSHTRTHCPHTNYIIAHTQFSLTHAHTTLAHSYDIIPANSSNTCAHGVSAIIVLLYIVPASRWSYTPESIVGVDITIGLLFLRTFPGNLGLGTVAKQIKLPAFAVRMNNNEQTGGKSVTKFSRCYASSRFHARWWFYENVN